MESDPVPLLSEILATFSAVKREFVALSLRMHDVEQRLNKLEYAVYTPPASPSSECSFTFETLNQRSTLETTVLTEENVLKNTGMGNLDKVARHPTSSSGQIISAPLTNQPPNKCSGTCHPVFIRNGMEALSVAMKCMDFSLNSSMRKVSSPLPIESTNVSRSRTKALDASTSKPRPGQRPFAKCRTPTKTTLSSPSLPDNEIKSNTDGPENVRHIFGQPSTPNIRRFSFDMTKSPFEKYKNDSSPFQQIVTQNIDRPSCLNLAKPETSEQR